MRKIQRSLKDTTLMFLILIIVCISFFVYKDYLLFQKIYIYNDIGSDTLNSYWPYFHYVASEIQNGSFPFWMDNVALGNNIFSVPSLIFDPFNILLFLVNADYIVYALPYIAVLKILVAGVLFYKYLSMFKYSKLALIVGSLIFAFNGYLILWGQHHTFGTFVALVPLVMWGFERWLQQNKITLLVFSSAILAANNFYLFFMFSLFLVIYAFIRFKSHDAEYKGSLLKFTIKTTLLYLFGVLISSVLLLPTIYALLTNSRVNGDFLSTNIFSFDQAIIYVTSFFRFFSNDMLSYENYFVGWANYYESPMLYCGLITLILVPYILFNLKNKKNAWNSILLVVLFVFLLFPFFSFAMNAFSSEHKRWTFVIIITLSYLSAYSIDFIEKNKINSFKPFNIIISILFVLGITMLFTGHLLGWESNVSLVILSRFVKALILISIYAVLLYLLKFENINKYIKILIVGLVAIELFIQTSASVNNRTTLPLDNLDQKIGYNDYTNEAVDYLEENDSSFYRINKDYLSIFYADPVFQNYRSFTSYNSLNNPSYVNFLRELEVPFKIMDHNNYITGLDNRAFLENLLGTKYYLTKDPDKLPYGYKFLNQEGDIYIYENKYSLPLGITYDTYISEEEFDKLSSYMKDIILTKAVVIKDSSKNVLQLDKFNIENINLTDFGIESTEIVPINSIIKEEIGLSRIEIESLNNDPQLILKLSDNPSAFSINTLLNLNIQSESYQKGQIYWRKNEHPYIESNSKVFMINPAQLVYELNLGYIDADEIRIDFAESPGEFILSDIEFLGVPLTIYEENMKKISYESLEVKEYSSNKIYGDIKVSQDKVLVFSIPYDKGWTVNVNGKSTEIIKTNIGLMGINLTEGSYEIELKYSPPFLKVGSFITLISLLVFLIIRRKYKRVL